MDTLRWILLIFGLILIVAVYFTGRRQQPHSSQRREPDLDDSPNHRPIRNDEDFADDDPEDFRDPGESERDGDERDFSSPQEGTFDFEYLLADAKDTAPAAPAKSHSKNSNSMLLEDEFVIIHLMASTVSSLSGSRLYSALHEIGFELEEDAIFHYRQSDCPLIVVNMFKPGTFPGDPDDFTSKGISFILRLSRTDRPLDAFDEMVALAYELRSTLNLQLFDMQRSSLTKQTIAFLEEEIAEYQRRRNS